MPTPNIIDSTDRLHLEVDSGMRVKEAVIETFQEIPSEFTDRVRDIRTVQDQRFAQDDVHIASLPASLVDHWYRQGFSIWDKNVTPQDILTRLQREDLTAFICTSKTFG
jgi:hypothetical protein